MAAVGECGRHYRKDTQVINELIAILGSVVVAIVVGAIGLGLRELRSHLAAQTQGRLLTQVADIAVRAVEQQLKGVAGSEDKLTAASDYLIEQAALHGVTLSETETRFLVEAAVQKMNAELTFYTGEAHAK